MKSDVEHDASPWILDDDRSPPRPRRGPTNTLRSRRGKILDAALTLFLEAGYSGASMQDIAREAGASIGSVYHHFGGKEDIAAQIFVAGMADYQRGLTRELLRRHDAAEEAVKAVVRHHLRWTKKNRELATFLLTSRDPEVVGASSRRLDEMNRALFSSVQEWTERWVDAGAMQRLSVDLLHAVMLGPSQEFCRHWVAGRTEDSIDKAEPVLADAAWKAVRA